MEGGQAGREADSNDQYSPDFDCVYWAIICSNGKVNITFKYQLVGMNLN